MLARCLTRSIKVLLHRFPATSLAPKLGNRLLSATHDLHDCVEQPALFFSSHSRLKASIVLLAIDTGFVLFYTTTAFSPVVFFAAISSKFLPSIGDSRVVASGVLHDGSVHSHLASGMFRLALDDVIGDITLVVQLLQRHDLSRRLLLHIAFVLGDGMVVRGGVAFVLDGPAMAAGTQPMFWVVLVNSLNRSQSIMLTVLLRMGVGCRFFLSMPARATQQVRVSIDTFCAGFAASCDRDATLFGFPRPHGSRCQMAPTARGIRDDLGL